MKVIFFITTLFITGFLSPSQAQYWEIGAMGGVTVYHGDLAPDFSFQAPGVAVNAFVRRNIDERFSLRFAMSFGSFGASDANSPNPYQKARNLSFNSTVFEGSIGAEFNFLPFHHHSRKSNRNKQFSPYIVAGFGVFYHNPTAKYMGASYPLQPLGTEGQAPGMEYSLIQPALIVGGGFKIDINQEWGIIIEGATRILFFDYLDDVSNTYADPRLIAGHRGSLASVANGLADRSGEVGQQLGAAGRQRGNSKTNDGYTMFSIGITYTIHEQICPAW